MGWVASQRENELVLDVLSISEPAFAINGKHRIVAWNDAAERLLGIAAQDVIGARCYEALDAVDGITCGECPTCPAGKQHSRRSPASSQIPVSPTGQPDRRLHMTTLTARTTQGRSRIVHLLREEQPRELPQTSASPMASPTASGSRRLNPLALTQRELEVLRLLGAGHSTADIAVTLSITRVTARNHVNRVIDKLGANSRLHAVVLASQSGLIQR
jgi:DNA-binding CsgD family transcriptional regulator